MPVWVLGVKVLSAPSTSVAVRVPPVVRVVSSCTRPLSVPPMTAASLVPMTSTVMTCSVPSAAVTVKVSDSL
ncbi:hypothetical protein D3C80_1933130 [compost metagenome]